MSTAPRTDRAPIPQPAPWPVLGNLPELDRRAPVQSFIRLARQFGPIYRMQLPGRQAIILSGRDLGTVKK
jgi:cytochrome P450/NADPH-cytochrome P450 reductase